MLFMQLQANARVGSKMAFSTGSSTGLWKLSATIYEYADSQTAHCTCIMQTGSKGGCNSAVEAVVPKPYVMKDL